MKFLAIAWFHSTPLRAWSWFVFTPTRLKVGAQREVSSSRRGCGSSCRFDEGREKWSKIRSRSPWKRKRFTRINSTPSGLIFLSPNLCFHAIDTNPYKLFFALLACSPRTSANERKPYTEPPTPLELQMEGNNEKRFSSTAKKWVGREQEDKKPF